MPRNRIPKRSSKWYLPKYEYRMVVNFCLSYYSVRERLAGLGGIRAQALDGMPHGTDTSDPTQREAMLRSWLTDKIVLIESTVREVCGDMLYQPMMMAVTRDDVTIDQIMARYSVPMGRVQFINLRRKVYWTMYHRYEKML